MSTSTLVGIGHLTMLDVPPPDWVTLADQAGFDAVGIRAAPAATMEEPWPMEIGSPMLLETLRRLSDTGISVLDVEIVKLTPNTAAEKHEQLFEVGAELGARFLNVIADDPDLDRTRDNFAALVAEAGRYGLRPVLEPMIYMGVRNLAEALAVVDDSGGGIMIDPLHLQRFGGTPDDLRALDPALLPFYQLCDAPLAAPHGLPRPERLPRGQSLDIDDLGLESRAARLLPGDGELPLAEIVAAMPPGLPVSVEAPNLALRAEIGALEFARRARRSVRGLVGQTPDRA